MFGNVLSVAGGLALVKVITREIPAAEYGQAALVLGIIGLLNAVVVGPLLTTHLRLYFDFAVEGQNRWFVKSFNKILAVIAPSVIVLYLTIAYVYYLFGNPIFLVLLLPAGALLVVQPFLSVNTNYLEANRRHRRLATVNILQKLLSILFLYIILMLSLSGAVAILVAQAASTLLLIVLFRPVEAFQFSGAAVGKVSQKGKDLKNAIFSFGWALPAGYMVQRVLTTGDRYLIEHFRPLNEVGIYSMNYGFWSMPFLMLNGWLEILTRPVVYDSAAKNEWNRVKRVLSFRGGFGLGLSLLGSLILYFSGERIARLMLGPEYWGGARLMILICLAHCLYVVGYSISPVFLSAKKTKPILIATALSATTNLFANIILIPRYGIDGAAFSTLLAYVVWVLTLAAAAVINRRTETCVPAMIEVASRTKSD